MKIGRYPSHHGGVGVIRTLGRAGVPVYAVTEDRFTPAALSRYCQKGIVWPTTGAEDPTELVARLLDIGRRLDQRSLIIPTDEEAAVLVAEHAGQLSETFLFPDVAPDLPRKLASKRGLYELCRKWDVPTAGAAFPSTLAEVTEFAEGGTFPVVAKNREAWERRRAPVVSGTTLLHTREELLQVARGWGQSPNVILQEYIPYEHAEDWAVHMYCDADSTALLAITGVKVRSWPPHAGMTACAFVVANPVLEEMARRFCKEIGFQGIADLDWRLDRRDGQYKLLDFNPRVGAQFRLFESSAGIDVVRALHLDLTGREVPASPPLTGRRYIVENIDLPARLAFRKSGYLTPSQPPHSTSTELAWLSWDDPVPFLVLPTRLVKPMIAHVMRTWRLRSARRRAERSWSQGVGPDQTRDAQPAEDTTTPVTESTTPPADATRESNATMSDLGRSRPVVTPSAKGIAQ